MTENLDIKNSGAENLSNESLEEKVNVQEEFKLNSSQAVAVAIVPGTHETQVTLNAVALAAETHDTNQNDHQLSGEMIRDTKDMNYQEILDSSEENRKEIQEILANQEEIKVQQEEEEEIFKDMGSILHMLEAACTDDASKEALEELKQLEQTRISKLQELNNLKSQYSKEKTELEDALMSLDVVSADLDQLYDMNNRESNASETKDSIEIAEHESKESIQAELDQLIALKENLMRKREFILSEYRNMLNTSDEKEDEGAQEEMETNLESSSVEELMARLQSSSVSKFEVSDSEKLDLEIHVEQRQVSEEMKGVEEDSEIVLDPSYLADSSKLNEYKEMIDSWIEKILMQLMELNQISSQGLGETDQVKILRSKLLERLEELQEIKEKINYYQNLLEDYDRLKDAKSNLIALSETPKKTNEEEGNTLVDNDVELNTESNQTFDKESGIYDELEEEIPKTWVEHAQVKEIPIKEEESFSRRKTVRFALDAERVQEDRQLHRQESGEIEEQEEEEKEVSLTDQRKLFFSVKDRIYKSAANLISLNEEEPFFLNFVFKNVSKMNTPYLRQKLMLAIEDILEENQTDLDEKI